MNILVTGGAGFIGSHTIRFLLENTDHSVTCVDDFNDYYDPTLKEANVAPFQENPRFSLHRADIRDFKKMKEIFVSETPDKICHLAARAGVRPSIEQPFLYEEVNVRGTLNLLELARLHGVKNFVFASSSSVYGNRNNAPFHEDDSVNQPISPYAATKKSGEALAYTYHHLYGLPITALRFFTVYGPSGRPDMAPYKFVDAIYNGKTLTRFGDGSSCRDYTYIDDIVTGVVSALEKDLPFEIINLGNNRPVTLAKFIETIERVVGKKADIQELPMQLGDVSLTCADIEKAQKLLSYEPKTSLEEGMRKFFDWYLGVQASGGNHDDME